MRLATILQGSALHRLRELPDGHVHTCVTSPPYYGLRDYKTGGVPWPDGWHGELGHEPTPELFVEHLVLVMREVRRVLHETGTCWLVVGDSRANDAKWGGRTGGKHAAGLHGEPVGRARRHTGLKPKDLVGIPWLLAFALRADGWHLRSAVTWAKGISFVPGYSGSCMPESVENRPTDSSEQVFLLAKGEDYFCDMHAVREKGTIPAGTLAAKGSGTREGNRRQAFTRGDGHRARRHEPAAGRPDGYVLYDGMRNLRSVWAIGTRPFDAEFCTACGRLYDGPTRGVLPVTANGNERVLRCVCGRTDAWVSHFATFPEELVEPCVLAGTSAGGCCPRCLNPRERVFEMKDDVRVHVDWRWTCFCQVGPPLACTVLDPFMGRGTTAIVALRHGRTAVGCELNPDYARMASACILAADPLFNEVLVVKEESDADKPAGVGDGTGGPIQGAVCAD